MKMRDTALRNAVKGAAHRGLVNSSLEVRAWKHSTVDRQSLFLNDGTEDDLALVDAVESAVIRCEWLGRVNEETGILVGPNQGI